MKLKLSTISVKACVLLLIYVVYVSARPSREDRSNEGGSEEDDEGDDDDEDSSRPIKKPSRPLLVSHNKPIVPSVVVTSDGTSTLQEQSIKAIIEYLEKFIQKFIKPGLASSVSGDKLPSWLAKPTKPKDPVKPLPPGLLQSITSILQTMKNPSNSTATTQTESLAVETQNGTTVSQPGEAAHPVEEAQPLGGAQPEVAAQTGEAVQPVEVVQAAEVAQPLEPMLPMEVAQPSETQQPLEAGQPSETQQPLEAAQTADILQTVGTSQHADVLQPLDPSQPAEAPLSVDNAHTPDTATVDATGISSVSPVSIGTLDSGGIASEQAAVIDSAAVTPGLEETTSASEILSNPEPIPAPPLALQSAIIGQGEETVSNDPVSFLEPNPQNLPGFSYERPDQSAWGLVLPASEGSLVSGSPPAEPITSPGVVMSETDQIQDYQPIIYPDAPFYPMIGGITVADSIPPGMEQTDTSSNMAQSAQTIWTPPQETMPAYNYPYDQIPADKVQSGGLPNETPADQTWITDTATDLSIVPADAIQSGVVKPESTFLVESQSDMKPIEAWQGDVFPVDSMLQEAMAFEQSHPDLGVGDFSQHNPQQADSLPFDTAAGAAFSNNLNQGAVSQSDMQPIAAWQGDMVLAEAIPKDTTNLIPADFPQYESFDQATAPAFSNNLNHIEAQTPEKVPVDSFPYDLIPSELIEPDMIPAPVNIPNTEGTIIQSAHIAPSGIITQMDQQPADNYPLGAESFPGQYISQSDPIQAMQPSEPLQPYQTIDTVTSEINPILIQTAASQFIQPDQSSVILAADSVPETPIFDQRPADQSFVDTRAPAESKPSEQAMSTIMGAISVSPAAITSASSVPGEVSTSVQGSASLAPASIADASIAVAVQTLSSPGAEISSGTFDSAADSAFATDSASFIPGSSAALTTMEVEASPVSSVGDLSQGLLSPDNQYIQSQHFISDSATSTAESSMSASQSLTAPEPEPQIGESLSPQLSLGISTFEEASQGMTSTGGQYVVDAAGVDASPMQMISEIIPEVPSFGIAPVISPSAILTASNSAEALAEQRVPVSSGMPPAPFVANEVGSGIIVPAESRPIIPTGDSKPVPMEQAVEIRAPAGMGPQELSPPGFVAELPVSSQPVPAETQSREPYPIVSISPEGVPADSASGLPSNGIASALTGTENQLSTEAWSQAVETATVDPAVSPDTAPIFEPTSPSGVDSGVMSSVVVSESPMLGAKPHVELQSPGSHPIVPMLTESGPESQLIVLKPSGEPQAPSSFQITPTFTESAPEILHSPVIPAIILSQHDSGSGSVSPSKEGQFVTELQSPGSYLVAAPAGNVSETKYPEGMSTNTVQPTGFNPASIISTNPVLTGSPSTITVPQESAPQTLSPGEMSSNIIDAVGVDLVAPTLAVQDASASTTAIVAQAGESPVSSGSQVDSSVPGGIDSQVLPQSAIVPVLPASALQVTSEPETNPSEASPTITHVAPEVLLPNTSAGQFSSGVQEASELTPPTLFPSTPVTNEAAADPLFSSTIDLDVLPPPSEFGPEIPAPIMQPANGLETPGSYLLDAESASGMLFPGGIYPDILVSPAVGPAISASAIQTATESHTPESHDTESAPSMIFPDGIDLGVLMSPDTNAELPSTFNLGVEATPGLQHSATFPSAPIASEPVPDKFALDGFAPEVFSPSAFGTVLPASAFQIATETPPVQVAQPIPTSADVASEVSVSGVLPAAGPTSVPSASGIQVAAESESNKHSPETGSPSAPVFTDLTPEMLFPDGIDTEVLSPSLVASALPALPASAIQFASPTAVSVSTQNEVISATVAGTSQSNAEVQASSAVPASPVLDAGVLDPGALLDAELYPDSLYPDGLDPLEYELNAQAATALPALTPQYSHQMSSPSLTAQAVEAQSILTSSVPASSILAAPVDQVISSDKITANPTAAVLVTDAEPTGPLATPISIPLGNFQTILDEGALVGPVIGPGGEELFPEPMVIDADGYGPDIVGIMADEYLKGNAGEQGYFYRRKTPEGKQENPKINKRPEAQANLDPVQEQVAQVNSDPVQEQVAQAILEPIQEMEAIRPNPINRIPRRSVSDTLVQEKKDHPNVIIIAFQNLNPAPEPSMMSVDALPRIDNLDQNIGGARTTTKLSGTANMWDHIPLIVDETKPREISNSPGAHIERALSVDPDIVYYEQLRRSTQVDNL